MIWCEDFDRNTAIWLNYKFSNAGMFEIGKRYNLSVERIRSIGVRRDRRLIKALARLNNSPFTPLEADDQRVIDTLYGIRLSYEMPEWWDWEHELHLYLEDPEKIANLVVGEKARLNSTRYINPISHVAAQSTSVPIENKEEVTSAYIAPFAEVETRYFSVLQ